MFVGPVRQKNRLPVWMFCHGNQPDYNNNTPLPNDLITTNIRRGCAGGQQ